MLEAQRQAEQLLTKEYLRTQHAQVTMNKETIERGQMLVSTEHIFVSLYQTLLLGTTS